MDSYRDYPSGRRSPVFNPTRASMPVVGYNSMYSGDIVHAAPSSRYVPSHVRGESADRRSTHHPGTTTTTYTVRKDQPGVGRSASTRDASRTRRSSTMDSSTKRPIIVTTTTAAHPHGSVASSATRTSSPPRDPFRSGDGGPYYAQPGSSSRYRPSSRYYNGQPASATLDNEEIARLRDRQDSYLPSRVDPFPRGRPTSMYANPPRLSQGAPVMDYAGEGYEYTKPSDLVRYDLDHDDDQSRHARRRRDSFESRSYLRPSISISTEMRPFESGRRGPPPTTWGLDKMNWNAAAGIYDPPQIRMPVPPIVPLPPPADPARRSGYLDPPPSPRHERRSSSRQRPVSLIQDNPSRAPPHDDYRSREPELRDRERERDRGFHTDDAVNQRGFGIRIPAMEPDSRGYDEHKERREVRRDYDDRELRRGSDETFDRHKDDRDRRDRDDRKSNRDHARKDDDGRDRKGRIDREKDQGRQDEEDPEKRGLRDKVAAGLGIAAASMSIGSSAKSKDDKAEKDDKEESRRRTNLDDERRKDVDEIEVAGSRASQRYRPKDTDESSGTGSRASQRYRPKDSGPDDHRSSKLDDIAIVEVAESKRSRKERSEESKESSPEDKEKNRREAEAKLSGEVPPTEATPRRRRRPSNAFKPTDTAGLMELKAQLAAKETKEAEKTKDKDGEKVRDQGRIDDLAIKEPSPERRTPPSPEKRDSPKPDSAISVRDDVPRGRPDSIDSGEKQVRIISPPREKDEKKPLKGILKNPSTKFPEEANPIREGVAPHKDDKTKQGHVPLGARWTKVNRALINPDALRVGKERFEVRDDFVIVLRVLSKEEIEAYTAATAQLREMRERRRREETEKDGSRRDDYDRREHRHRREKDRDDDDDRERDRDRERERERERERDREDRHRHRHHHHHHARDEADEDAGLRSRALEYPPAEPHRSHHKHRDDREAVPSDIRTLR